MLVFPSQASNDKKTGTLIFYPLPKLAEKAPPFPKLISVSDSIKSEEAPQTQYSNNALQAPECSGEQSNPMYFIFCHESGNNPLRWNDSGCVGIGQACPASKLLAVCPTLDYSCEVSFFTSYMLARYGSWEAAKAWWIRTDCRPYCQHWW